MDGMLVGRDGTPVGKDDGKPVGSGGGGEGGGTCPGVPVGISRASPEGNGICGDGRFPFEEVRIVKLPAPAKTTPSSMAATSNLQAEGWPVGLL